MEVHNFRDFKVNRAEVTVEVDAKEAHGNSVIIEENIEMRTSLPPPYPGSLGFFHHSHRKWSKI